MTPQTLSFEAWRERYQPEDSDSPSTPFALVARGSPQMEQVYSALKHRPANIWSLVRGGTDPTPALVPGYVLIDCLGYVLTNNAYRACDRRVVVTCDPEAMALMGVDASLGPLT